MDPQPERKKDFGRRVEVYWPDDYCFYRATVVNFSNISGKHQLHYDDGYVERIVITESKHRWLEDSASPKPEPIREAPPPDPLDFEDLGQPASTEKRSRSAVKPPPKRNTPTHSKFLDGAGNAAMDGSGYPLQNGTHFAGRLPSPLQSLQTDMSEADGFDQHELDPHGDDPLSATGVDEVTHPLSPRKGPQHSRVGVEVNELVKQRPVGSITSPRQRLRSPQGRSQSPVGSVRSSSKAGRHQRAPLDAHSNQAPDGQASPRRSCRGTQQALPQDLRRASTPSEVRRANLRMLIQLACRGPPGNPLSRLLQQKWLVDLTQTDPPVTVWVAASIKHNINLLLQIHLPVVLKEGLVGVPPELLGPYLGHLSRPPYPPLADLKPAGSDHSMGQEGGTAPLMTSSTHAAQALQSAAAALVGDAAAHLSLATDATSCSQGSGEVPRFTPEPCIAAALRAIFQKPKQQQQQPTQPHQPTHSGASAGSGPLLQQPVAHPSSSRSSHQLQHPGTPTHFSLRTQTSAQRPEPTQGSEPTHDSDGAEQAPSGEMIEGPEPHHQSWPHPERPQMAHQQPWPLPTRAAAPTHPHTRLQRQSGHAAFSGPDAERLHKQSQQLAWAGLPRTSRMAPHPSSRPLHVGNASQQMLMPAAADVGVASCSLQDDGMASRALWDDLGRPIPEAHPMFQQQPKPLEHGNGYEASGASQSKLDQPILCGHPRLQQPTLADHPPFDQPTAIPAEGPLDRPPSSAAAGLLPDPPSGQGPNAAVTLGQKQLLQQLVSHVQRNQSQQQPGGAQQGPLNSDLLQAMRVIAGQRAQQPVPNASAWSALAERLGRPMQNVTPGPCTTLGPSATDVQMRHFEGASVLRGQPRRAQSSDEQQPHGHQIHGPAGQHSLHQDQVGGAPCSESYEAGARSGPATQRLLDQVFGQGYGQNDGRADRQDQQPRGQAFMPAHRMSGRVGHLAVPSPHDAGHDRHAEMQSAKMDHLNPASRHKEDSLFQQFSIAAPQSEARILHVNSSQPSGWTQEEPSGRGSDIFSGCAQAGAVLGSSRPVLPFMNHDTHGLVATQNGDTFFDPVAASHSVLPFMSHHNHEPVASLNEDPSLALVAGGLGQPAAHQSSLGEFKGDGVGKEPQQHHAQQQGHLDADLPSIEKPLSNSFPPEAAAATATGTGQCGTAEDHGANEKVSAAVDADLAVPLSRPLQPIQCSSPRPGWDLWKRVQQAGSPPPATFAKHAATAGLQPPLIPQPPKPPAATWALQLEPPPSPQVPRAPAATREMQLEPPPIPQLPRPFAATGGLQSGPTPSPQVPKPSAAAGELQAERPTPQPLTAATAAIGFQHPAAEGSHDTPFEESQRVAADRDHGPSSGNGTKPAL